ncbi:MAG: toxic anion resistance protein, partial [Oscillospiraceae bacterium]|nr:toxic anion resistance protein [Oscillospiraceae bacterium]
MSENNMMPELTLDPQATEAVPALTLDAEVVTPATPAVVEPPAADIVPAKLDDSMLSEAEKQVVEDFSKKINIMDSNLILQYGAAAQKNVAGFSENALASVRSKDLGEVGNDLAKLVGELQGFGQEEK